MRYLISFIAKIKRENLIRAIGALLVIAPGSLIVYEIYLSIKRVGIFYPALLSGFPRSYFIIAIGAGCYACSKLKYSYTVLSFFGYVALFYSIAYVVGNYELARIGEINVVTGLVVAAFYVFLGSFLLKLDFSYSATSSGNNMRGGSTSENT